MTDTDLPQQTHSQSQQQQTCDDAANDHPHGNVTFLSRFTDGQHHLDSRKRQGLQHVFLEYEIIQLVIWKHLQWILHKIK